MHKVEMGEDTARWGRGPDNVELKMGEETQQCQSKDARGYLTSQSGDGGGDPTMPKWRWEKRLDNVKAKMGEDTRQCQRKHRWDGHLRGSEQQWRARSPLVCFVLSEHPRTVDNVPTLYWDDPRSLVEHSRSVGDVPGLYWDDPRCISEHPRTVENVPGLCWGVSRCISEHPRTVEDVPGYESLNGNLRLVLLHRVSQKLWYP